MQVERLQEIAKRYSRQVVAVTFLATSAALAACGGKSEGEVKTTPTQPANSPVATETIAPTATLESTPTPEPVQFVPKKLSKAEFVPTRIETVLDDFNTAFNLPGAGNVVDEGGNKLTREELEQILNKCQFGRENSRVGLVADRIHMCSSLALTSMTIYKNTQYEEFYTLAIDTANFFLTQHPESKAEFDNNLQAFGNDSSPVLEK
jgi:hypothetical protein